MESLQFLSWMCLVFTVWMFSTGMADLKSMILRKSTENVQFLPFLMTAVNALGWRLYGELRADGTLIRVNFLGFVLQTAYIVVYGFYCPNKVPVMMKVCAASVLLLVLHTYLSVSVTDPQERLNQLGLMCSSFTIAMYLSPLIDLVKIVRSRSTQCLSFSLSVATFLASTSWSLYGLRLRDPYIVVPNVPGIVTSLIRFWLFWKFPRRANEAGDGAKVPDATRPPHRTFWNI